jgi:hypothetical protein
MRFGAIAVVETLSTESELHYYFRFLVFRE